MGSYCTCCSNENRMDKRHENMERLIKDQNKNEIRPNTFKLNRNSYIQQLSHDTKKYIAMTHFFASIWMNFFNDHGNKCEYMKSEEDGFNILDYVLIRGGCCRNIVWNKTNINDVDTFINCGELTKLHLSHLNKYHSTKNTQQNSKCILWLLYAKKFEDATTAKEKKEDFEDDKVGNKISFSSYMLNTRFLINILENNDKLQNKIDVYQYGRFASWNITVIDNVHYAGYNLRGCDLDFVDLRKSEIAEFSEKVKVSTKPMTFPTLTKNCDFEVKPIDLPIYPSSYIDSMRCADLTMNTLIIHWSDVVKDENGKYTNKDHIDYDWRRKIQNPIDDIDGIKDALNYKLKTWGNDVTEIKYVLGQQKPKIHIWRVIKMYIKLGGECAVDQKLIQSTIEMYPKWFAKKRLLEDDEHCKTVAHFFVHLYAKKGAIDVRFQCFELLKFNELCRENMNTAPTFKKYVMTELEDINDDALKEEIERAMKQYKYI
eukprot:103766_1